MKEKEYPMPGSQSPIKLSKPARKAQLNIKLSEFEIPPMQDVLLIGVKAPIGPEAARRMVDAMSPQQYEIIDIDHPIFEAVVIKKSLLNQIDRDKLLPVIVEESERIADTETVIKAQVNLVIEVNRSIDI
jgi:hypothetical protein